MDTKRPSRILSGLLVPALLSAAAPAEAGDWPWWRGPDHTGHAEPGQDVPTKLEVKKHVLLAAPVPGKGHGSPIVAGDRVYLTTADEEAQTQSLLCYDRNSGREIWTTVVHRGGLPERINQKATHASSTPACDGERLIVNFMNGGAVHTTALSLDGERLWQTKITDYIIHQGYGSSPVVYKSLVLVSADNKAGGAVCGLNRANGEVVWKVDRPKMPNYVSPIVLKLDGRDQLVLSGCETVLSLDPATGEKLWESEGSTTETVTSVVTDGARVFISGGYPKNHVAAIEGDGSGTVAWQNISRVYVPSMLVKDGHLYAVMDGGAAMCWDSKTGEEKWKGVLGGTFTSSPVLVGEHIHVLSELGEYFVFKADPAGFELVSKSQLGEQAFATPTICGGRIFARVVEFDGEKRQEKLYCLGAASS